MGFLIESTKFLLFSLAAIVLPGSILVGRLNLNDRVLRLFLSTAVGIVLATLAAFVHIYLVYGLAVASLFLFLRRLPLPDLTINFPKISLKRLLILGTIGLGTLFQNAITFRSGRLYDFGIGYWGPLGHDGVWHQALVNQLLKATPPENPGLSGTTLTNYHYFYDLLVAATQRLTGIGSADLIFRFYPILFSLLLGVGTYFLARTLFNKWYVGLFSLFFVYFGGSFGYIVEWIKQRTLGGESAFWANQPVSMNLNPPFAVSLILLIASVLVFYYFSRKKDFASGAILVLLSGTLIEFKVYAGLIVLSSLGAISLFRLLRKDSSYLKVFIPSFLLSLLVYLPNNSGSQSLVVFSPFWLVDSMIDFSDRVGWIKMSQARAAYFSGGVWPKFILAELVSLAIFIVGNLGTRIVAAFAIPGLIKKRVWKDGTFIFIGLMTLASIVPALLFVQKGNPWNTIQFVYYFLYFGAIFSGLGIVVLAKLLPRLLSLPVIILVILATSISSFSTFRSAFQGAPSRLSLGELQALKFLEKEPSGIVLTYPFNKDLRKNYSSPYPLAVYETSAYVSAFSGKTTFVEDEFQQEIFQNDYRGRLKDSDKFFNGGSYAWSQKFLSENNIAYIYLPKLYGITLDKSLIGLEKIFSNEEADIYKVEK